MESFSKLNNIKGYRVTVDCNGGTIWSNGSIRARSRCLKFRNSQLAQTVPFRYGMGCQLSVWERYSFSEFNSKNFNTIYPLSTHSATINKFSERIDG